MFKFSTKALQGHSIENDPQLLEEEGIVAS